jgi:hypothetical protein
MAYWGRVAARACKEITLIEPWRVYSAIGCSTVLLAHRFLQSGNERNLIVLSVTVLALTAGFFAFSALTLTELAIKFVLTPAKIDRERVQKIQYLELEWQNAQNTYIGAYTESELDILNSLLGRADDLYKVFISRYEGDPAATRDAWIKQHEAWRERVLRVLNEKDGCIFACPVRVDSSSAGHKFALDQIHGRRRGQILEEKVRLAQIIERNNDQ